LTNNEILIYFFNPEKTYCGKNDSIEEFPETIHTAKIVGHKQRESFHFEGSSIVYSLLWSRFSQVAVEAFLLTIVPARKALLTNEIRAHIGEEFCYVLQGVLRLWYGETFFDLYPGDSVYYKTSPPLMRPNSMAQALEVNLRPLFESEQDQVMLPIPVLYPERQIVLSRSGCAGNRPCVAIWCNSPLRDDITIIEGGDKPTISS
jgi:hypothetical protein